MGTIADVLRPITSASWAAYVNAAVYATAIVAIAWLARARRITRPLLGPTTPQGTRERLAHQINTIVIPGLISVAIGGAALSYRGVVEAVPTSFGPLRYVIPILADALIAFASGRYIALAKLQRPAAGWRIVAHLGVAATIYLNILSTPTWTDLPWHLVGPTIWSLLVELAARDVLGELRATRTRTTDADRIPLRLWLTAPAESIRTGWRMARTGTPSATTARVDTERCAAARDRLRAALPGWEGWRARRQILRRLWSGALDPAALVALISLHATDPAKILPTALETVALGRASEATGHAPGALIPALAPVAPDIAPKPCPVAPEAIPVITAARAPLAQTCEPDIAPEPTAPLADKPRAVAAPVAPLPRVHTPIEDSSHGSRRGSVISVHALMTAAAAGEVNPRSRDSVKARFKIGTTKADQLIKQWKEHN